MYLCYSEIPVAELSQSLVAEPVEATFFASITGGSTSSPPLECVYFKEPVAESSESLVAEPVEATFYNYYQKSAYKAAVISNSAKAPTLNTAGVAKMPFSNGIPLASSPPRFSCRLTMTITNMDSKAVKPI